MTIQQLCVALLEQIDFEVYLEQGDLIHLISSRGYSISVPESGNIVDADNVLTEDWINQIHKHPQHRTQNSLGQSFPERLKECQRRFSHIEQMSQERRDAILSELRNLYPLAEPPKE